MAIDFSGTGQVRDFVGSGILDLSVPETIRTKIRKAIVHGFSNTVKQDNGFYFDIGEVHTIDVRNFADRKNFPSVDVIWDDERYTNQVSGGNSLGGYNKIGDVLIEGYFNEYNDIELIRERFIADIEKYFGTYHYIPDSGGNHTVFNSIIINNKVFGIDAERPRSCISILLRVYYRIELENPNQDF